MPVLCGCNSQPADGDVSDAALRDLLAREDAILGTLDGTERAALAVLLRSVVAPFDA